jgi:hypothetical protein
VADRYAGQDRGAEVKINTTGTPFFVQARRIGGIEIIQGRGRVRLSPNEVIALRRALDSIEACGPEKTNEIGEAKV